MMPCMKQGWEEMIEKSAYSCNWYYVETTMRQIAFLSFVQYSLKKFHKMSAKMDDENVLWTP